MSQGANPWSDLGCREALRLLGENLEPAVHDASDSAAREQMMWAATLAGIAFGNAGVHAPHGMAYAVAGLVRDFHPSGYPDDEPLVPHGMSVSLTAPEAFRFTFGATPERHLAAARLLDPSVSGDGPDVLPGVVVALMRDVGIPNGLAAVGYEIGDVDDLVEGALRQERLLSIAPRRPTGDDLAAIFRASMEHW